MIPIHWSCKRFDELSTPELYCILHLRSTVFVVEQNCVYLDTDNRDAEAYHLCGWLHNKLVAYCRLLPPGVAYPDEASIGRVVTAPAHRNSGFGQILMSKAIPQTFELFSVTSIKIGAQQYLTKFYGDLGFSIISEPYLEDGIPHVQMRMIK